MSLTIRMYLPVLALFVCQMAIASSSNRRELDRLADFLLRERNQLNEYEPCGLQAMAAAQRFLASTESVSIGEVDLSADESISGFNGARVSSDSTDSNRILEFSVGSGREMIRVELNPKTCVESAVYFGGGN